MSNAQLFIDPMPELGPDARAISIECRWARSVIQHTPGADLELSEAELVTAVLMLHERECGRCSTAALWPRADRTLADRIGRSWRQLAGFALARDRSN